MLQCIITMGPYVTTFFLFPSGRCIEVSFVCFFLSCVCLIVKDEHQRRSPAATTQQAFVVELMRQGRQRGGSQEPVAVEPAVSFK